jgi:putative transposase
MRIHRPMLVFKDFHCARTFLRGIELMRMIVKGDMKDDAVLERSVAEQ